MLGAVPFSSAEHVADPYETIPLSTDSVFFTVTEPDFAYTGQDFPVGSYAINQLPVPILLTITAAPRTSDICGISGFEAGSSGTSVRRHEFLLNANGSAGVVVHDLTQGFDNTVTFGDTIAASLTVKPKIPGECRIEIVGQVSALSGVVLELRRADLSIPVYAPPPFATLGTITTHGGGCGVHSLQAAGVDTATVGAGAVDFMANVNLGESCPDDDDSLWVAVAEEGAYDAATPSSGVAHSRKSVAAGTTTLAVSAVYLPGWPSFSCLMAIAAAVLVAVVGILALLDIEPMSKIGLTLWLISLVPVVYGLFSECENSVGSALSSSFSVNVNVIGQSLSEVPDVGGTIDAIEDWL